MDSIPLPAYEPLTRRYCNTYLIDAFSRDLSIYNNPENKILVSRNWINYNQQTRQLQILKLQEVFNYHIEFSTYLRYLNSTQCNPDFTAKDHSHFLAQLQKLD
jgi:hypothetical protein